MMLQFYQARKYYGEREVLSIPVLDLPNAVYWLQGVNGSGKTTLLRMVAGLIPFDGDILFNGINLHQKPLEYRRQISWAEAEPIYPVFITGRELIRFYQDIKKGYSAQTEKLIIYFGMQHYLSATIGSYSSGMIKRLSLMLAFIGNPRLILLDEPMATLDEDAAILLPGLIREYQEDHESCFILSSHHSFNTSSLSIFKKLLIRDQTIHLIP